MEPRPAPDLSVIVPVFRQWHLVPKLLDHLRRQTMAPDRFEVILVNNGCPDFVAPSPVEDNVSIVHCPTPGSYAARNCGAAQARGRWIVFTDADCLPYEGWLSAIAAHRDPPDRLLAGQVEMFPASEAPNRVEIFELVKGIPQERYVTHGYGATANLAVPRSVFEVLGGFDGTRLSGGDAEFCRRAGRAGYPVAYLPDAAVRHPARSSWAEVATKARRVRGGQMAPGTPRRYGSLALPLVSPLLATWRFARDRRHPLRHRGIAISVAWRLCLVELVETMRLRLGRSAERR